MFAAFNFNDYTPLRIDHRYRTFIDIGKNIGAEHKKEIADDFKKHIVKNREILNGEKIIDEWFKSIDAKVFISHSHQDEDLALALAGYLKSQKSIISFVDSTVWGYAPDLIRKLDDEYSLTKEYKLTKKGPKYDYNKRNISTSHVHMMLSTSLMRMIDRCECIIFINTPNSIESSKNVIETEKTYSPWIFAELAMINTVRISEPRRSKPLFKSVRDIALESASASDLAVAYPANISKLIPLSFAEINYHIGFGESALDRLYSRKVNYYHAK